MKKIILILAISAMFISCQSPMLSTSKAKTDKSYTVELHQELTGSEGEVNTNDKE